MLLPGNENFVFADLFSDTTSLNDFVNPQSNNFFGNRLTNSFRSLLEDLFVPDEANIDGISNSVKSKFVFIDNIKQSVNALNDTITNLEGSPRLTMNLGATKYTPEQRVVVLDLSWYAPFKPYGDLVLTGFIYLFFLWRLFISIPSIISGVGGAIQGDYMLHEVHDFRNYGVGRSSGLDRIISIKNGGVRR